MITAHTQLPSWTSYHHHIAEFIIARMCASQASLINQMSNEASSLSGAFDGQTVRPATASIPPPRPPPFSPPNSRPNSPAVPQRSESSGDADYASKAPAPPKPPTPPMPPTSGTEDSSANVFAPSGQEGRNGGANGENPFAQSSNMGSFY